VLRRAYLAAPRRTPSLIGLAVQRLAIPSICDGHSERTPQPERGSVGRCDAEGAARRGLRCSGTPVAHPNVVSERRGRGTVSISLDTYSHAIPAMQEEEAPRPKPPAGSAGFACSSVGRPERPAPRQPAGYRSREQSRHDREDDGGEDVNRVMHVRLDSSDTEQQCDRDQDSAPPPRVEEHAHGEKHAEESVIGREAVVGRMGEEWRDVLRDERTLIEVEGAAKLEERQGDEAANDCRDGELPLLLAWQAQPDDDSDDEAEEDGVLGDEGDERIHRGSVRSLGEGPQAGNLRTDPQPRWRSGRTEDDRGRAMLPGAHTCPVVVPCLVGRMSAVLPNRKACGRLPEGEIAICRQDVVPPGWIEQPTPGLGNLRKA